MYGAGRDTAFGVEGLAVDDATAFALPKGVGGKRRLGVDKALT